jgi:hypothetical protein
MFLAENQQRIGAKIMTDKTGLTDLTREYATHDSPQAHRVPERRRWTGVMMRSLPALVVPQMPIPRPDSARESYARRR